MHFRSLCAELGALTPALSRRAGEGARKGSEVFSCLRRRRRKRPVFPTPSPARRERGSEDIDG